MNKKILRTVGALLLVTALVISLIPVSDVEAASTSDFQMEGSKLLRYAGTSEIVSIPADVKVIGEEAFAGNSNIIKVNINEKCDSIEYGAFSNCPNLRTVNLGDGVEKLGSAVFANDPNLKTVNLGASLKTLGSGVFAGDTELDGLTLSAANEHLVIMDNVLYDDDLTNLYYMLPNYNNYIYEMPNSVTDVSGYAFWGNDNLINVKLGSGLYTVPEFAFSNCQALKVVQIPLPVHNIDSKAFEDCVSLAEVECPESINYISPSAFDGCPNITIKAVPGTYAYGFGRDLQKSLIDELEYEDVEDAALVTQESVISYTPVTRDENEMEVVSGDPMKSEDSEDGESANSKATPTPYVNASGVINGADVMGITYADKSTYPTGETLGASSIVSGRAMIFIDNMTAVKSGNGNQSIDIENIPTSDETEDSSEPSNKVNNEVTKKEDNSLNENNSEEASSENANNETAENVGDIIKDNAKKGIHFPKFTIVGDDTIASQAYYLYKDMTEYEIPDGIKRIGEFAFARSGLTSITIPDGVEEIGYGAFYHCDDLAQIKLPSSVTDVSSYAFNDTAFVNNSNDEFVIVGDGILIAYKGTNPTVNIPEGVKIIADGTFRDNQGITAVNFPESLVKIGEDAFNGCTSLLVANRGNNITEIGANAYKGTKLSNVTIYENVESIGTGAFDLINGTDTVTFEGETLPKLVEGVAAKRIANSSDRTYAFGNMKNAIIKSSINSLTDTVLEPGKYGFKGLVKDEFGNTVSDNSSGVFVRDDNELKVVSNSGYVDANSVGATIAGGEGAYTLHITDSQNAREAIALAYGELYGGRTPDNLIGVDITLKDASDTLDITKLGKQYVKVTMHIPSGINKSNLHVVALDADGQLEAVNYNLSEDGEFVTFRCNHFSPYGFYNYGSAEDVEKTGDRIKDDTPDTGDLSIHPKWFLCIGCVSLALVLFLITGKKKNIME